MRVFHMVISHILVKMALLSVIYCSSVYEVLCQHFLYTGFLWYTYFLLWHWYTDFLCYTYFMLGHWYIDFLWYTIFCYDIGIYENGPYAEVRHIYQNQMIRTQNYTYIYQNGPYAELQHIYIKTVCTHNYNIYIKTVRTQNYNIYIKMATYNVYIFALRNFCICVYFTWSFLTY